MLFFLTALFGSFIPFIPSITRRWNPNGMIPIEDTGLKQCYRVSDSLFRFSSLICIGPALLPPSYSSIFAA